MIRGALVLLGDSPACRAAAAYALDLARRQGAALCALAGVDLSFIETSMPGTIGGGAYQTRAKEDLKRQATDCETRLAHAFEAACREKGQPLALKIFEGDPMTAVLDAAAATDVLVTGHDVNFRGNGGEALSDMLATLLLKAPRPVIVCPDAAMPGGDVLLAFDGSVPAVRALQLFALLGAWEGRRVHVVSLAPDAEAAERLTRVAGAYLELRGYNVERHAHGADEGARKPSDLIRAEALRLKPELLVMGAFGHRGLKERLFGTTTEALLADPPATILTYH